MTNRQSKCWNLMLSRSKIFVYQNIEYKMDLMDSQHSQTLNIKIPDSILSILNELSSLFVRSYDDLIEHYYQKNLQNRIDA